MNQYSEQALIERPAIALLQGMGWAHLNCMYEVFRPHTPSPQPSPNGRGWPEGMGEGANSEAGCLGRESPYNVVLEEHARGTEPCENRCMGGSDAP